MKQYLNSLILHIFAPERQNPHPLTSSDLPTKENNPEMSRGASLTLSGAVALFLPERRVGK